MVEDETLKLLKMKKMLELQKKMLTLKKGTSHLQKIDYYQIFIKSLTEDGRKMYKIAENQYSIAAKRIATLLGKMIYEGKIKLPLNAEVIYGIFYELGLPIRIETKIVYKRKGEVKSISDIIKESK